MVYLEQFTCLCKQEQLGLSTGDSQPTAALQTLETM